MTVFCCNKQPEPSPQNTKLPQKAFKRKVHKENAKSAKNKCSFAPFVKTLAPLAVKKIYF